MSFIKILLSVIILAIAIYFISWVLNVADPFNITFFIVALIVAISVIIVAILLKLRIVGYGQLFGYSSLGLLFMGVGLLLMAVSFYIGRGLLNVLGPIVMLVGVIVRYQADKAHNK